MVQSWMDNKHIVLDILFVYALDYNLIAAVPARWRKLKGKYAAEEMVVHHSEAVGRITDCIGYWLLVYPVQLIGLQTFCSDREKLLFMWVKG